MTEQQTQDQGAEQVRAIKSAMISQARQMYVAFIDQLRKFPTQQFALQQAFINFDQGMYWLTEGLANAELQAQPVAQAGDCESVEAKIATAPEPVPAEPISEPESLPLAAEENAA